MFAHISSPLGIDRPAHALYFAAYEEAKRRLVLPGDVGQAHLATAAAGAIATVVSDTVNVPFDTVKQRLQVVTVWPQHCCACMEGICAARPVRLLLQLS